MGRKGLGLKARAALVFLPTLHGHMTLLTTGHRAALHGGSGETRIGLGGHERHVILDTFTNDQCMLRAKC